MKTVTALSLAALLAAAPAFAGTYDDNNPPRRVWHHHHHHRHYARETAQSCADRGGDPSHQTAHSMGNGRCPPTTITPH